jgi:hypothetical protein
VEEVGDLLGGEAEGGLEGGDGPGGDAGVGGVAVEEGVAGDAALADPVGEGEFVGGAVEAVVFGEDGVGGGHGGSLRECGSWLFASCCGWRVAGWGCGAIISWWREWTRRRECCAKGAVAGEETVAVPLWCFVPVSCPGDFGRGFRFIL